MLLQEFVIAGFLESNDRKSAVGSLVLAYCDEGGLVHAGRAGTGYSAETSRNLYELLRPLKIDKPRFRTPVSRPAAKGVIWVKPEVVAEIEYRGRTTDGLLRQAAFAGLREDKPAAEVTLEQNASFIPQHVPPAHAVDVTFTHPDRILWDDAGVTKQALANYYTNIAEWILPHVQGRVVSLLRCPGGTAEKCFFAKHAWMGLDPSVKLVDIGDEKPMLMVNDLRGLLELVQMNVLEIHVWGSRAAHLDRPDRLVFDLDPGDGVAWPDVRNAAVELRQRLEQLGLRSFVKTTGGKGLHVVVPVRPDVDWDFAKAWCKAFAQQMAQDSPARYVATMTKSRRAGRIFIDYLRNGRGATAVAPYSTRARPGAAVATPLDWTELGAIGSAAAFTLQNVEQRLANLSRDPWEDMMKVKQALPR